MKINEVTFESVCMAGKVTFTLMIPEEKKDSYPVPPIFPMMQKKGEIDETIMYNTFNMGIGMVVAVDAADAEKAMEAMRSAGDTPYVIGSIEAGKRPGLVLIEKLSSDSAGAHLTAESRSRRLV